MENTSQIQRWTAQSPQHAIRSIDAAPAPPTMRSLAASGRRWPQLLYGDAAKRQVPVDPALTGLLDECSARVVDRGDGGDDLERLDLRSPASARHPDQVAHPLILRSIAAPGRRTTRLTGQQEC